MAERVSLAMPRGWYAHAQQHGQGFDVLLLPA